MAPFIQSSPEVCTYSAEAIQQKLATIQLTAPTAPFAQASYPGQPFQLAGAIEAWSNFDVTPVIGREFANVDLASALRAENSDELIRDLAITISRRGIVFFRKQDDLDNTLQKELVQHLGQLAGKLSTSGLHIHPFIKASQTTPENKNDQVSVISSQMNKNLYQKKELSPYADAEAKRQDGRNYSQKTDGDTLFGSGYELYDRISAPYQKLLDGPTATFAQSEAPKAQFKIYSAERGAPENSIYALGSYCQKINGLAAQESCSLQDYFTSLLVENHGIQVRFRWANVNAVAIWDNRCIFHAATPDIYEAGLGERVGQRAVSLGGKPYFDENSVSRRSAISAMTEGAVTSALL